MKRVFLILFFIVVMSVFTVSPVAAQITLRLNVTVNITADVADANLADALCDTNLSKAGNQCSLRAAFDTVRVNGNSGTVTLPAGVYPITGQGKTIIDFIQNTAAVTGTLVTVKLTDANGVSYTTSITAGASLSTPNSVYRQVFAPSVNIGSVPIKGTLTVQFKSAGKLYIDDIFVYAIPAIIRDEATTRDGADALPLPEAPDGFRGEN